MAESDSSMAARQAKMRQKLVFSIAQFLASVVEQKPAAVDTEGLEVGLQCVQAAFGVDITDDAQKEELAVDADLEQIFRTGLALGAGNTPLGSLVKSVFDSVKTEEKQKEAAEPTEVVETEEDAFEKQYASYINVLAQKGYFGTTTPGTPEYEARADKARAKLRERVDQETAARKEQAQQKKAEGNAKLSARQFQEAVDAYSAAIDLDPTNAIYYANRAAAHTHLRNHAAAVVDCKAAIKRDPSYVKAYSRLGLAHFSQAQYAEAVEAYKKAAEMEPDNATVRESLKIAERKMEASKPAGAVATGHEGHSHAAGQHNHNHGPAAGAGGMPDFASLLSNPAMMNLMNQFGAGAGAPGAAAAGAGAGGAGGAGAGPAGLSGLLNNPAMMGMAEQLMSNPAVGGLLNNPAIMNMATSMMQNPDMLSSVLGGLGGAAGAGGAGAGAGGAGAGAPPPSSS